MPIHSIVYYTGKSEFPFQRNFDVVNGNSSIYGSAIFNFGTVLVMSIVRSIFPDREALRLGAGLSASALLLFIGRRYIQYIDQIFDAIRFRAITRS